MKRAVLWIVIVLIGSAGFAVAQSHPTLVSVAEQWKSVPKGMEAPVVLKVPGMDLVKVSKAEYASGRSMDIYYPGGFDFSRSAPVVVFVMGYSTEFTMNWFGARLKDLGQYVSWGELVAASGMIGVAYETDYPDDDIDAVLDYIGRNGSSLGMDSKRIALFGCSGNTLTALGALASKKADYRSSLRCGVIMYPIISYFMNTGEDVMPAPFKRQLRTDLPIFMVTVGNDRNEWMTAASTFTAGIQRRGLPVEVAHYAQGVHGFDTDQDTEDSKALVAHALAFMKDKLAQ